MNSSGTAWQPTIRDTGGPKYLALVEVLQSDIASGVLRDGDRLPPQREIAERLDVTIATITKAFREAGRRGIVTAKTGSGTFIRVREQRSAADLAVPDLSLNTVPIGPAKPHVEAALAELARRRIAEVLCAYEPTTGSEAHRALMARWLRRRGISVAPSGLLLTHGGQHALAACLHVLARPGDTVLCEQWTYTGIKRLADLTHLTLAGVAMDGEGLLPDSLEERLAATGAKVVIATAAVQNPTTATMSLDRRRRVVAACDKAGAILVEDDIYGALSGEDLPPLAALGPRCTVHISSVSKCIAPTMRLGSLVAPGHLLAPLANALTALHWTAPTFWAEMFEFMLEGGLVDRCLAGHREEAARRLAVFEEVMGHRPSTALPSYHVWQRILPSWRIEEFVSELQTAGVRVSPAQHFAAGAAEPGDHVRICLGGSEDTDLLRDALGRYRAVADAGRRMNATII